MTVNAPPADGRSEGTGWPYVIASDDRGLGYNRIHIARSIQSRHDATLIAAAPAMLAALRDAADYMGEPMEMAPGNVQAAVVNALIRTIRNAIEKATTP